MCPDGHVQEGGRTPSPEHLGHAAVGKVTTPQPAHRRHVPAVALPAVAHTPVVWQRGHANCMPTRMDEPLQPWQSLTLRMAMYMPPLAPKAAPGAPRAQPTAPPMTAAAPSARELGTPSLPLPWQTMQWAWSPSTNCAPPHAVQPARRSTPDHDDDCGELHSLHACTGRLVKPIPRHTLHGVCQKWPRSLRLPRPPQARQLCGSRKRYARPSHRPQSCRPNRAPGGTEPVARQTGHLTVGPPAIRMVRS